MLTDDEAIELEHAELTALAVRMVTLKSELRVKDAELQGVYDQIAKKSFFFWMDPDGCLNPGVGCC